MATDLLSDFEARGLVHQSTDAAALRAWLAVGTRRTWLTVLTRLPWRSIPPITNSRK
jgi:hypothetical protein